MIDEATDKILQRVAPPGKAAQYIRVAIIEKAARDELRDELEDLRARLEHAEARLGIATSEQVTAAAGRDRQRLDTQSQPGASQQRSQRTDPAA